MATRRWRGGARAVAQVQTFTFGGTWEANDLIRVTIGARTYDFTAGSTTTATVVSNLVTAWEALDATDYPEFAEITASANSADLVLTADTAGKPFTATLTPLESNGGAADSQTIAGGTSATTGTATTAATGPNHWDNAANWKEGVVPANSDDVTVDEGPSILYGLDQNGVDLASLTIGPGFPSTSDVGLPWNTNPTNPEAGYPEYRDQRLKVGATVVTVNTTSGRVRLNLDTTATTVTVNGTGTPRTDAGAEPALDLVLVNSSNVVRVNAGSVWVAGFAGDAATVGTVAVAYRTNEASDARVRLGAGLTLTTLEQSGGDVEIRCAATTVERTGGTLTRTGSGAVTTLTNNGGTVYDEGTGTVTTVHQNAELYRRGLAAVTYTTLYLYANSVTLDPNGTFTLTNPVQWVKCHAAGPPADPGPRPAWFNFGFDRDAAITDI